MNRQQRHHSGIILVLLAFLFVQLPFSAFHHHEVLDCSAAKKERTGPSNETHLHTKESDHCFVCSGYLLKDYETTATLETALLPITQFSHYVQHTAILAVQRGVDNSRAPPVFS